MPVLPLNFHASSRIRAAFMSGLIERARKLKKTIVFPEGDDPRVLEAAARLAREGVVRPMLIGPKPPRAPRA